MSNFLVKKEDKYTVISVTVNKLDSGVSPDLKSELVLINNEGEKNVIIDLSLCKYCDSSGLSAVLIGRRLCANSQGSFILCGLQESVSKLIAISQLDTVLSITPTLDEAIQLLHMEEVERDIEKE